jgi:mono/diheme cytochrome c family protein
MYFPFAPSNGTMHLRAAFALIVGFAGTAHAQGGDPPAAAAGGSTLAGVYTDVQAGRGEAVFRQSCLSCHVPTDYQGDAFKSKFVGGTAFDMFEQIRTSMPQSDPGGLPRQQYADILAYLFKLNELPAGRAEVSTDAASLKAIKVEVRNPSAFRHFRTTFGGIHHGSPHIR